MKAVLVEEAFSDPDWIYEVKLDGERCLAVAFRGTVKLLSRNQKSMNASYPEIVESLEGQGPESFIIDGEVVAFEKGVPSFSRLQRRMHVNDPVKAKQIGVAVFFYVFDVLHVDGWDVTQVPLRARKSLLRSAFSFEDRVLRFVEHRNQHGERYFRNICAKPGWEGLIAKRADSTYKHNRSRDWLKFKCSNEQEFVIGGYTEPQGSREGFGALLLGVYDGDDLVYAGKVGTGYDTETLLDLSAKLRSRERKTSPFVDDDVARIKGAHFVRPDLVAQIGFAEWTPTNRLRHPRFLGLRRDKPARDVVRERPR
ncbi:MAG: ATP-dependent DNA ligase [Actinobacteria bacterium]|nr:ATP-dependent DNA ligase [Actinomycetota bacterium]